MNLQQHMSETLSPGSYVVAISGGVDSIVLLHCLAALGDRIGVVAHFDHGIRPESSDDVEFVQQAAATHGTP